MYTELDLFTRLYRGVRSTKHKICQNSIVSVEVTFDVKDEWERFVDFWPKSVGIVQYAVTKLRKQMSIHHFVGCFLYNIVGFTTQEVRVNQTWG